MAEPTRPLWPATYTLTSGQRISCSIRQLWHSGIPLRPTTTSHQWKDGRHESRVDRAASADPWQPLRRTPVSWRQATSPRPMCCSVRLDAVVPEYRLHMLQRAEGPAGPRGRHLRDGLRRAGHARTTSGSSTSPCRLSLVPVLFRDHYRPDVVLLHTSSRRHDTVSLGTEVNILPAAIESVRERGGLVIVQSNPRMPYTYGDAAGLRARDRLPASRSTSRCPTTPRARSTTWPARSAS